MKIKHIDQIKPVQFTGGKSFRAVLESDNMGYAVMKTVIPKGVANHWYYPYHLETCYCIEGKGELIDLKTGEKHLILPDTVYVLDQHDDHTFQALEDTVLISIFNPPLRGDETHDENGIYKIDNKIKRAW